MSVRDLLSEVERKHREYRNRIKELQRFAEISEDGARNIAQLLSRISSRRYKEIIERAWDILQRGKVVLTVDDYYQFWTDLHIDNNVIFFRCTSRIDPKLWESVDMQLYETRQITNVKFYNQKDTTEKEVLLELVKSKLKAISIDGNNFERIFLVDEFQIDDDSIIDSLSSVISRQVKGGIQLKLICIKANERPTFRRPQDFGIAVTEEGDKLLMYLEVGVRGEQEGGQIIFDEEEISSFEKCYMKIEQKAILIKTDNPREIKRILKQLRRTDISEIYGSRCFICLQGAEDKVESGAWKEEKTPLKTWYEIVKDENEALRKVLLEVKPSSVLEIGCGPGRIIRQILKLKNEGKLDIGKIESYEQNPEICSEALKKINGVKIIPTLVGADTEGKFNQIRSEHVNRFDMVLAVSNLVGWQKNEEQWIKEVLRAGKNLFLTAYKRGYELERARMYKAAGDVVGFVNDKDIELVVDAFYGQTHVTKAYREEEIEAIINNVAREIPLKHEPIEVGKYMWGYLLTKSESK